MNSESGNYEDINCPDDDQYRVYCDVFDKIYIERFYKIHLKSQTHLDNIREWFQIFLYN